MGQSGIDLGTGERGNMQMNFSCFKNLAVSFLFKLAVWMVCHELATTGQHLVLLLCRALFAMEITDKVPFLLPFLMMLHLDAEFIVDLLDMYSSLLYFLHYIFLLANLTSSHGVPSNRHCSSTVL